MRKAIIDNSVLRALYHLDLLKEISLIYSEVFLPRAVEKEFLSESDFIQRSKRFNFFERFATKHRIWFQKCEMYTYEDIQIRLSDLRKEEKKIHQGEGEALVQNQLLDLDGIETEVLLDENIGRKFAKSKNIKHHGVLYILAQLDLRLKICNYQICVQKLINEHNCFFGKKIIKTVYENVKLEIENG